jgi:outer membrane protein OmpA-like peptidoglycan-associated protein
LLGATLAGAPGAACGADWPAEASHPQASRSGGSPVDPFAIDRSREAGSAGGAGNEDAGGLSDRDANDAAAGQLPDVNVRIVAMYGATIVFQPVITFTVRSSTIPTESEPLLTGLAQVARDHRIRIDGYADASEGAAGRRLALERAEHVRAALVERGVDPSHLTVVGNGADSPLDPTPAGRKVNPRITFSLDEPDGGRSDGGALP